MEIKYFDIETDWVQSILGCIRELIYEQPERYISLCGGSTPKLIYKSLAASDIDLAGVHFFQGDERYIEQTSDKSNYKLIKSTLLSNPQKKIGSFHHFDTSLSKNDCLDKYENELETIPKKRFDLSLLGIGPDGHFASIFPHSKALVEKKRLCMQSETDIFDITNRLTLTAKMVKKSKTIIVMLKGDDKKDIIDKLYEDQLEPSIFPAKALLNHKDIGVFYLR